VDSNNYIYGDMANPALAEDMSHRVRASDGLTFHGEDRNYLVVFRSSVKYMDKKPETLGPMDNAFEVSKKYKDRGSEVNSYGSLLRGTANDYRLGQTGHLDPSDKTAIVHEVAHTGFGLRDRIKDGVVEEGWKENIMAYGNNVEQRNIQNALEPYYKQHASTMRLLGRINEFRARVGLSKISESRTVHYQNQKSGDGR
ncbi:MAG: hypothetical protein HZB68_04200, partial [Candidatus Aenigmarchaeota archaeon]|nr:hypothetical protein [Candidatus Aenigmarchaeota archaeon]